MTATWGERVGRFWRDADADEPMRLRAEMAALVAERPADDPEALFERASLHDFLGEEAAAIPLYRAALSRGLDGSARSQAIIQLGSSLRNVGDASAALALLNEIPADDPLAPAARAFACVALHDDQKPTEALREALSLLAPHLPAYSRAISAYADELVPLERIRAIAVGLLVHDGHLLAEEYPANDRHDGFLRAPGGGVQFGEPAEAAVRREFAEELGVRIDSTRLLAVTENIFDAQGKRGHEIAHVFAIECTELTQLPVDGRLPVLDSDTSVGWYRLDTLRYGSRPLCPAGVLDLLR